MPTVGRIHREGRIPLKGVRVDGSIEEGIFASGVPWVEDIRTLYYSLNRKWIRGGTFFSSLLFLVPRQIFFLFVSFDFP